jgi:CheY-like chemotaxis protein
VCDLVRAILTSRGYTVLSARFPQEAERIARTHQRKIDLLLTDVIMPGMSGRNSPSGLQCAFPA